MRRTTDARPAAQSPGRRERAKADKRERILAAAKKGFAEHGYDRLTMAQVATDADVAAGTVFQYAATKPELLMMVIADRWGDTIPTVIAQVGDHPDPGVVVSSLLNPLLDASVAEPNLMAAATRELLFGDEGPHRAAVVGLINDLEESIADALIPHTDADRARAAARLIMSGGLVELNRGRLSSASTSSTEERLAAMVRIAIAGAQAD